MFDSIWWDAYLTFTTLIHFRHYVVSDVFYVQSIPLITWIRLIIRLNGFIHPCLYFWMPNKWWKVIWSKTTHFGNFWRENNKQSTRVQLWLYDAKWRKSNIWSGARRKARDFTKKLKNNPITRKVNPKSTPRKMSKSQGMTHRRSIP